jgi:hypothetical protein
MPFSKDIVTFRAVCYNQCLITPMRLYQRRVFLIYGFITMLILAGAYFILRPYLDARREEQARYKYAAEKVNALMSVKDPKAFTKEFNPMGQTPVDLEVGSGILGLGGRVILSPYFPHQELITEEITQGECHFRYIGDKEINLSTEQRSINTDPYWNVFWVEISKCYEPTKFFGPYRLLQPENPSADRVRAGDTNLSATP